MQRLSIVRWQRTQTQYIGVIQTIDRFKPGTLKVHDLGQGESVIVGELVGTYRKDWYALAYNRADMDFEEARSRAMATLDRESELRAAGKPSLTD